MVMVRVTLTFDLSNLKINRGHLSVMINFPTKSEDCMLKRSLVIDRTIVFCVKGHTDRDLWITNLKINKAYLQAMTNYLTQSEDYRLKHSLVIDRVELLTLNL